MAFAAFAHESGLDDATDCYAIGAVVIPSGDVECFNESFSARMGAHCLMRAPSWKHVDHDHRLINFSLEWLHHFASSELARFAAIVVNTRQYRKWSDPSTDRVDAFYATYTYLLKHLANALSAPMEVFIDDRPDEYAKHDEVLEIVGNRMLAHLPTAGRLEQVTKVSALEHPALQLADLFTGAICDSHRLFLDPTSSVPAGKRLAISRMAQVLGLDALHYDTWPNTHFNIWHFPTEYRAVPATVEIRCSSSVPLITAAELSGV